MPRTTPSAKAAAAATSNFGDTILALASTDAETLVVKAMVEDLGTSLDKDPGTFPTLVGALRAIPKGDARTDMASKTTVWYLTAAGVSANMEHVGGLAKAVSEAASGSAPKVTGPTPEQMIEDAIIRYNVALATLGAVGAQIDDSFDKEMASSIKAVGWTMIEGDSLATAQKLVDRASFLAKPMTGRKGSTGPKAQIKRDLANVPNGLTFMFKEVSGEIKDGKLVVEGEAFDNPSRAACSVARTKGVSKPSFNGWEAWRSSDGRKLADVHADHLDMVAPTETEVAEEVTEEQD